MADAIDLAEDDFLLAGELSLAVLEGEVLASARRRQLAEPAFAAAVAWWDERLSRMAEADSSFVPSPDVLRGIHAELDRLGRDPQPLAITDPSPRGPSRWSIALATLGTGMAAAALVLYLVTPTPGGIVPPTEQIAPSPQLVAQLQDAEAQRRLTSVIDPATGRLAIRTAGLDAEAGKIAELWVIPAGGVPVSLGEIPGSGTFERELSERERALVAAGASLAVTFEQDENIRHQTPTAPILLVGALDEV